MWNPISPIVRAVREFRGSSSITNRRTVIAVANGEGHLSDPAQMLGNPLRNLTPANAATLIDSAMRGQWTRIQWLMYYVEQWDADVWTLVERRCAGLRQLDWTIRVDGTLEDGSAEAKLAEQQRAYLHDLYARIDNMREAVEFLALAKFRGYAHLAIGDTRLEPIDQWWWVRDGLYGEWYYNPEAKTTTSDALGEPVKRSDYLIREEPRSLLWLAILKFLRASHQGKWWDQFCEICSRQGTVIIGPPNLTQEQAEAFQDKAAAIARGGSGVLENGSSVTRPAADGKGTGQTAWEARLRYLKEDLILAGTGGMLTALSQATGIGGSQGEEQGNVWRSLLRADAGDISEVLQRQFDAPRLAAQFPGQPIYAWFELDASEQPSTDAVLDHAVKANQAGYVIDSDQLAERTGYQITRSAGVPPANPPDAGGTPALPNRRIRLSTSSRPTAPGIADQIAEQLGIPAEWLAPVADELAKLEAFGEGGDQIDAAALAELLDATAKRLPQLYDRMDHDALANVLETAMGTAVVAGAEAAKPLTTDH